MKFKIKTSCYFYQQEEADKLKPLGFKFEETAGSIADYQGLHIDDLGEQPTIELNTLEELLAFIDVHGVVIVSEHEIKIYDGWVE